MPPSALTTSTGRRDRGGRRSGDEQLCETGQQIAATSKLTARLERSKRAECRLTRAYAEYIDTRCLGEGQTRPPVFYGTTLLVVTLLLAAMWRAVAVRPELLRPDVSGRDVERILRATAPNLGFYVAVTLLAVVAPHVAAFGYLVIAILLIVRARGSERTSRH